MQGSRPWELPRTNDLKVGPESRQDRHSKLPCWTIASNLARPLLTLRCSQRPKQPWQTTFRRCRPDSTRPNSSISLGYRPSQVHRPDHTATSNFHASNLVTHQHV